MDGSRSDVDTDVSKSPPRIAAMFDAIAGRYDFLNHVLSAGIDRTWRTRAIRSLHLTGTETLLDLCTGTGDVAIAAVRHRPAARRVLGIDFAGEMLRVGRQKLQRVRLLDRVTLARGDAASIPVADGSVDAVTIAFGIRNVEQPDVACREMSRVLTKGGRIAILEFAIPTQPLVRRFYLWYSHLVLPRIGRFISRHAAAYRYLPASISGFAAPDAFVTILRQAGFQDVAAVPLTFGIVFLYTARKP